MKRSKKTGILLVLPGMFVLFVLFVYPIAYNLWMSLYTYSPVTAAPKIFVGTANYQSLFSNFLFINALMNTLVFTGGSVVLEFFLGLGLALLLVGALRTRKVSTVLLLVPLMLPIVVSTLAWKYMFMPGVSVLNHVFGTFIPWLSDANLAMLSMIIVDAWKLTPFMMIILLAGILSISTELQESIKVDGASRWQEFWYITFPLLKPFILLALVVRSIDAFTKVFAVSELLTSGGPGVSTMVLPQMVYRLGLISWDWGLASAASVIAMAISLIFAIVWFRVFKTR